MTCSPRLAVGTVQEEAESHWLTWALLGALRSRGLRVQHFYGRACMPPAGMAATVAGSNSRHLDSWLMSPQLCRRLYSQGAESIDLSIVEGRYRAPQAPCVGGSLDCLCDWLSLPKLAIVDVSRLRDCQAPILPRETQGLLLDRVPGLGGLARWRTQLEPLYRVPVLGALPELESLRAEISRQRPGAGPPADICSELGDLFARFADLDAMIALAQRRFPHREAEGNRAIETAARPRIAVAYDCAFNAYFADTLEQLELHGADVLPFSPLYDEGLPAGSDIVYIGSAALDQHAGRLSENQCMLASLRDYYRRGGRIYAECGGLGYLSQGYLTGDGSCVSLVGAAPGLVRSRSVDGPLSACEAALANETWLGPSGATIRGYGNARWQFEFAAHADGLVRHGDYFISCRNLVGSLLHVNFASQPELLARFFARWPQAATAAPLAR